MRNPGGYSIRVDPGAETRQGRRREWDTFTCQHCNKVVFVKPMCDPASMGGRCNCCDGLICPSCVGKGCDPLEKKLERLEARKSYEAG
jgi:hypothetical protein